MLQNSREVEYLNNFPFLFKWLIKFKDKANKKGIKVLYWKTSDNCLDVNLQIDTNSCKELDYQQLSKELSEYTNNHCSFCGNEDNVQLFYLRDPGIVHWCERCRTIEYKGWSHAILYDLEKSDKCDDYKTPHIKVRLKGEDGHIFYKFADELFFKDNKVYIGADILEPVLLSGVFTNLRDSRGERVYTGDIIKGYFSGNENPIIGMIRFNTSWGFPTLNIPENQFYIDIGDHMPPFIKDFERFYIIGNVAEHPNYSGPEPNDYDHGNWFKDIYQKGN